MSLNGLDNVEVTQAYQGALAEAGGCWRSRFLLRYTSRDSVQVLKRGTGGAGEARAAVAQYEDKSPLYGLLLYRRRKVLVKYVPDGTSRLLQARVAVHFINISEKFAPHDIVLSISTPEELSDAALASACSLHTAAPSSSSSSGSSRGPKLSWIQETAEETCQPDSTEKLTTSETADTSIPTIMEPSRGSTEEDPTRCASLTSQTESVPLILEEKAIGHKIAPHISHVTVETVTEPPKTPENTDLSDLQDTFKNYDSLFEGGPEPRSSSQTTRPDYNELYEHYYAQYTKPKVKLGPRPRQSLEGKRPATSGNTSQDMARQVASLPAGLRSAARKAAQKKESETTSSSAVPAIAVPPPLDLPPMPEVPHSPVSSLYTPRSPISVKSMPVAAYKSHLRATGTTQERTRLMKALELRKKQQQAQQAKKDKAAGESTVDTEEAEVGEETADSAETAPTEHGEEPEANKEVLLADNLPTSQGPSNSGLVFADNPTEGDDLNSTVSISSPISAQTHGSSGAPSTRPSSLSDDESGLDDPQKRQGTLESQAPDPFDEEHSVDSTPTVVADSTTPSPPTDAHDEPAQGPLITQRAPSFDDDADSSSRRNTLRPAEDDTHARRRSNRESTIYMPSDAAAQPEQGPATKRNRESMLLPAGSKRDSWFESKGKRRAQLDPLHVSAENSETEYLSDDSFMEELQSATVHEAKPMSVSKSPIMPFFPRKSPSQAELSTPPRSASSNYPTSLTRPSPEQQPARKVSGGWPPPPRSDTSTAPKKINVSSGISQRIKALAEKTNRESASVNPAAATLSAPSSSVAQRKSSFFASSPLDTSSNGLSASRNGNTLIRPSSSASMIDRKPSGPIKSTVYNVQQGPEKPESVQVTARIVRDERTMNPTLAMPTEGTPLDLHQSPLIIDHQIATPAPKSPPQPKPETPASRDTSSSHSRDHSLAPSRTSSESTWRTFGRRMSESRSVHSHDGDEKKEDKKEKKESRTTKMFKRMSSSMSSMPWKSSSSSLTLPENDMRSTSLSSLREPPPPMHVGDLNVQFPDTLLWKRRWVEIDSMGNLVLSPSKHNEKGIVKRFHLSDFRAPYPPDQDRQELPNSVVLDFVDGRTLQCACETHTAQAQVLQILREAHDAWLAYNQAQ
ncbi:hypothetical protein BM1_08909 [Bipolaris maydis]|nr:hypothetical protein BM1_08909 [Bipolaris maydis]KAJ6278937.1 hypothetical protein J3E71DRAFT_370125 [Bipolaris maydis]